MNYNTGSYNQPLNYLGIPFGNYNVGRYNSNLRYNAINLRFLKPKEVDLFVNQGGEYSSLHFIKDSEGTPVDLSNCRFDGVISRYSQTATTKINILIVDAKAGKIMINIPTNLTSVLSHSRYVYDIRLTNDSTTFRIQNGQVLINNR